MKTYINRRPNYSPWGGGAKFVNAFCLEVPKLGSELVTTNDPEGTPDVILIAGLENDGTGMSAEQAIMYRLYRPDVKLILRVNECDARKATTHMDGQLLKLAAYMDGTVFVSQWMSDYFVEKGWPDENRTVIVNGVDGDVFKPAPKLGNGKTNIVAHHWSENLMKGYDIYNEIDELCDREPEKFSFTYIGRHRNTFKHTNCAGTLNGKKLGEELGKHDVYVSASRFDPGPNHILESLSCGLPTYVHIDGGGCVEFAGDDHVFKDWPELETLLRSGDFKKNDKFTPPTWQACISEYNAFMEATCRLPTKSE